MTYRFHCPMCGKFFRAADPGEPVCTGPSETRDEHEPTLMRLHSVDREQVSPMFAEARANAPLIIPCR